MPHINNKTTTAYLSKLDQMSSGIKKNVKNPRVANTVQEKVYDDLKEHLETVRNKYLQAQAAARKAYDLFEESMKDAHQTYAGDVRIIKGIFGRTAEDLTEFGIAPEKTGKRKEKATV